MKTPEFDKMIEFPVELLSKKEKGSQRQAHGYNPGSAYDDLYAVGTSVDGSVAIKKPEELSKEQLKDTVINAIRSNR